MPRQRHKRDSAKRVFMISNVPVKERNELGKQIIKLGAVCAKDATKFQGNVTHVVCGKLARSEKFLGALALGIWVVRPDYVTASADAKQWLDEVDYEWSILEVDQSQMLAVAAKRNRWRASTTTEEIFNDWQVAVALSDVKCQQVYKRLLVCGGAKVWDLKLPIKDPLKYVDHLTYLFVDSNTVNQAQSLQDYGVVCLNADYISDYLVMHPPPDLMNYLMQVNAENQQPENFSHTSGIDSINISNNSAIFAPGSYISTQQLATASRNDEDDNDGDEKLAFSQFSTEHSSPAINRSSDDDGLEVEVLDLSQCHLSQNFPVTSSMNDCVVEISEHLVLQEKNVFSGDDSVNFISEGPGCSDPKPHRTKAVDNSNNDVFRCHSHHSTAQNGWQSKTTKGIRHAQSRRRGDMPCAKKNAVTVSVNGNGVRPSTGKDKSLPNPPSSQAAESAVHCSAMKDSVMEQVSLPPLDPMKDSKCPVVLRSSYSSTSLASTSTVAAAAKSKTIHTLVTSVLEHLVRENKTKEDITSTSVGPATSTPVVSKSGITTSTTPLSSTASTKMQAKKEYDSRGGVTVCDYKKEMKSLSDAVITGGTMQALASLGKKVQTSLRGWFSPVGKENGSQGEVVKAKEACAQSKLKRGLAAQPQSQRDRDIKMTGPNSDLLPEQKNFQDRTKISAPDLPVPECASNTVQKPTPVLAFKSREQVVTDSSSKVISKQFAEECTVAEVQVPKWQECISKPSVLNLSDLKGAADVILTSRTEAAPDFILSKPNSENVESFSDQNSPGPELNAPDVPSERKSTSSLPQPEVFDQAVLRQPLSKHVTERDSPADKHRSCSPDVVLSARSVNNIRVSERNKTHTQRMASFMETVHRKRKGIDLQGEESPGEASPGETELETALPRRPKTVRGLSQRMDLESCIQKSDSLVQKVHVSGLENEGKESVDIKPQSQCDSDLQPSIPNQFFKQPAHQHQTSIASLKVLDSCSVLKPPESEALLKRKFCRVESLSGAQTSSPKAQVSNVRWQLSSVRLPSQGDISGKGLSTADDTGSRTIPDSICHIVSSCLDENEFQSAISTVMAAVNSCPTAEIFKNMVTVLKKAEKVSQANQANAVLNAWLDQFPPVTSTLRTVYEQGLRLNDWEAFRAILQNAVCEAELETEHSGVASTRDYLVLRLVVSILEKNFLHFAHKPSRAGCCNCLVIRSLWSPSYLVYPNGCTRDLLHFLETALRYLATPQTCWQELLTLVSMVIQCCHLVDNKWQWSVSGQVDSCSGPLVRQLAQAITGGGVDSASQLQQVLSYMSPPWLLREVVAILLEEYDDYLVPGGLTSGCITFKKIVSKYFFLLPKLSAPNKSANASPRKKVKKESKAKDENKAPAVGFTACKINKKNSKGETLLHKAAMKNDISLLKQMLSVPGVDINAQDFAGWTPLHEACNHGHVECVRALLKFVPSTTLHNFFQSGKQCKVQRVDLNLANEEGITPLHDAVTVNQISIVKLLLKYGGPSLLKAKNAMGLLPVDLASTAEMRQVLTRDNLDLSFSQDSESFSQELEGQGLEEREAVPSSFIYREVLEGDNGTTPFSASLEEAHKFLTLLTFLLRSHMQVLRQERKQQSCYHQQQQGTEDDIGVKGKFYAECLQRHMKKITTAEVFNSLTLQLTVLETLLMESHS